MAGSWVEWIVAIGSEVQAWNVRLIHALFFYTPPPPPPQTKLYVFVCVCVNSKIWFFFSFMT